jgi:hypothetical protein
MRRRTGRTGLGLLAALALLLVPVATTIAAPPDANPGHPAARVAPVDHHGGLLHSLAPNPVGARRGAHERIPAPAVLATSSAGPAATPARAVVTGSRDASTTDLPSSSRPRAPPAVV